MPTLILLARVELQSGQYEKALEYSRQIQKIQPELFMGHELAGDAWMQMNAYAEAGVAYTQAWDRKPSATLVTKLSEATLLTGKTEEAVSILRTWLDDRPEVVRVQEFQGTARLDNDGFYLVPRDSHHGPYGGNMSDKVLGLVVWLAVLQGRFSSL